VEIGGDDSGHAGGVPVKGQGLCEGGGLQECGSDCGEGLLRRFLWKKVLLETCNSP